MTEEESIKWREDTHNWLKIKMNMKNIKMLEIF